MRYSGVLFDLFGTLIPPFRRREHEGVMRACAECLDLDYGECHRLWGEVFPRRMRGEFRTMASGFEYVGRQMGRSLSPRGLVEVEEIYRRFALESLTPIPGTLETLDWLVSKGVRLGLVSNCGPDVPNVWPDSVFVTYFQTCAFSCELGLVKPEPAMYQTALQAINLLPEETLYVGDGSDEELTGAAGCGLQPVLVKVDLSNTYDVQRKDVDQWNGPIVECLPELRQFLAAQFSA